MGRNIPGRGRLLVAAVVVTWVAGGAGAALAISGGASAKQATAATAAGTAPASPTVSPNPVPAGGDVTVSGTGCTQPPQYGAPVSVDVALVDTAGDVLASASGAPGTTGAWQIVLTVPATLSAGSYEIDSVCDQYFSSFNYPSVVLQVGPPVTPTSLSATPAVLSLNPLHPYLLTLTADLRDARTGAGVGDATLVFTAGTTPLCSAVTAPDGTASCDVLGVPASALQVVMSLGYTVVFAGNDTYGPSSAKAGLIR